jgi:hypothetical protein
MGLGVAAADRLPTGMQVVGRALPALENLETAAALFASY